MWDGRALSPEALKRACFPLLLASMTQTGPIGRFPIAEHERAPACADALQINERFALSPYLRCSALSLSRRFKALR